MILIMKAISVAAPSQSNSVRPTNFLGHFFAWCGYALSPGSVIFGPWFSFDDYLRFIHLPCPFNEISVRTRKNQYFINARL